MSRSIHRVLWTRRPIVGGLSLVPAVVLALSILLALSALTGCNESTIVRPGITEVRFQNPPTEVDILLVIDDSCSMADEQDKLSQGFEEFVEFFDVADVDYHIGIITTDMESSDRRGRLVGDTRIINRDTAAADSVFRDNVQVGIEGWGFERGLDAAARALGSSLSQGHNEGFRRDDAFLSIIFVSDEEDSSHYGINEYINFFRSLEDGRSRGAFNASALVGADPETLEPADCGGDVLTGAVGAVASERYADIAVQTGGVVGSICSDDFADIVTQMGLASSRLLDRFYLDRQPDPESIELEIFVPGASDDEGLAPAMDDEDAEFAWVYEEDLEAEEFVIRFLDITHLPPIDSRIVIRYQLF